MTHAEQDQTQQSPFTTTTHDDKKPPIKSIQQHNGQRQ